MQTVRGWHRGTIEGADALVAPEIPDEQTPAQTVTTDEGGAASTPLDDQLPWVRYASIGDGDAEALGHDMLDLLCEVTDGWSGGAAWMGLTRRRTRTDADHYRDAGRSP